MPRFISPIGRLLTLLSVLLIACSYAAHTVKVRKNLGLKRLETDKAGIPLVRFYELHPQCASGRKLVIGRQETPVMAAMNATDTITRLRVTKYAHQRITIQGNYSGLFLCFNKKGKLVKKRKQWKLFSEKLCEFREEIDRSMTMLHSAYNDSWLVGFSETGHSLRAFPRPRRGGKRPPKPIRKDCFRFLAKSLDSHRHTVKQVPGGRGPLDLEDVVHGPRLTQRPRRDINR